MDRARLLSGVAVVVTTAFVVVTGATGNPKSESIARQTASEHNRLDVLDVKVAVVASAGIVVSVTFTSDIERALGRGDLKDAVIALILTPRKATLSPTFVATRGRGTFGTTLHRSTSKNITVLREATHVTFVISGPGSENVGRVTVKAFQSHPFEAKRHLLRNSSVTPEWWEQIADGIAQGHREVGSASFVEGCLGAEHARETVLVLLRHAKERDTALKELKPKLTKAVQGLESDLALGHFVHAGTILAGIGTSVLAPLSVLAGDPGAVGLGAHAAALKAQQTVIERKEQLRDAIRAVKQDIQLADAYLDRNADLTAELNRVLGTMDAIVKLKCPPGMTANTAAGPITITPGR